MRTIRKGREPRELSEYRSRPGAHYDDPNFTAVKAEIRKQLLEEQGHLCAYCMQRIHEETMKVEHWHCQDRYPNEDLQYGNLLGVCQGNEGQRRQHQTCDTRKKDEDLRYNPANPSHDIENRLRYHGDGKITATEEALDEELNSLLNLNYSRLVSNRKAVVDAVIRKLGGRTGPRSPSEIRRDIEKWIQCSLDGTLPEYCAVAVYFLNKRLRPK